MESDCWVNFDLDFVVFVLPNKQTFAFGEAPPFLVLSEDQVLFQCFFIQKQAQPGYQSLVICLKKVLDEGLFPVSHIHEYLVWTDGIRASNTFLVATVSHQGPAVRATLRQWFSAVVRGVRVDTYPGSAWAAVAPLALARELSINTIMQ